MSKIGFLRTKDLVAAVSNCRKGGMTGFVSMPEDTFEFSPLTEGLKDKVKGQMLEFFRTPLEAQGLSINDFFLVKRVTFPNFTGSDTEELQWDDADTGENIGKGEFELEFGDVDEFPLEELEVEVQEARDLLASVSKMKGFDRQKFFLSNESSIPKPIIVSRITITSFFLFKARII